MYNNTFKIGFCIWLNDAKIIGSFINKLQTQWSYIPLLCIKVSQNKGKMNTAHRQHNLF